MAKNRHKRGRPKGSKNRPKPLSPEQALEAAAVARRMAVARLQALLESVTDPLVAIRLGKQIQALTAVPRGAKSDPTPYSPSERYTDTPYAIAARARRVEKVQARLAEYAEQRNARLPVPIVTSSDITSLRQVSGLSVSPPFTEHYTPVAPPVTPDPETKRIIAETLNPTSATTKGINFKAAADKAMANMRFRADYDVPDERVCSVSSLQESRELEGYWERVIPPKRDERDF